MADSRKNKNRCSFCGRTEDEVGFLITGMNGYICDSCATQAYEITQEALGAGKKASATKLNLKELPKPVEIKKFLDQSCLCRCTTITNVCSRRTAVMMWRLKNRTSSW